MLLYGVHYGGTCTPGLAQYAQSAPWLIARLYRL